MEYLVPALILIATVAVVGGAAWWLSRRAAGSGDRSAGSAESGGGWAAKRRSLAGRVSSENAQAASGRLDQEAHREVYRLIAAGRTAEAVSAYRRSTGLGTVESMLDIQALATYPQPWQRPAAPGQGAGALGTSNPGTPGATPAGSPQSTAHLGAGSAGPSGPGSAPQGEELVVPEDWLDEQLPADRPFELEVVRDETTVRISSDDLEPHLRDQLTAMVRDGRVEEAALELSAHTVLTAEEALEFLHILRREQGLGE